MDTVKVLFMDAEKAKKVLLKGKLLDKSRQFAKNKTHIFFPILSVQKAKKALKGIKHTITRKKLKRIEKKETTLRSALKDKLPLNELAMLKAAFDVVGTIAIVEIDRELRKRKQIIADTLLKINKTVKTVLKKEGAHESEFRTQRMEHLAGEKTKVTVHKENNIKLKMNVEEVYFSGRLATERKRISKLVKKDEEILVMFSGCAPYPCVLSKNTKAKHVVGIEINPQGHKFGLENVKLNKLKNVELICGDVKKVVPKLKKKFDRILMPLPKSAEDFLDTALKVAKSGTVIHFYDFLKESEFKKAHAKIKKACKKDCEIIRTVKCGQHAPYTFRICIDFRIK